MNWKSVPRSLFQNLWRQRHSLRTLVAWTAVLVVVGIAFLFAYSWLTFREIEELMAQTPVNQPTLIYSDFYVLRKGVPYADTFLKERLKDLELAFEENSPSAETTTITWKARAFDYPEALTAATTAAPPQTPDGKIFRPLGGETIVATVEQDRISNLVVNDQKDQKIEAVILEPDLVAQLAGSTKTIREYVKLDDIPTVLKEAIISVEDMRFRDHYGFDVRSLVRAFWINIKQRSLAQGGSTITQQLVKNLLRAHKKTLTRKMRELVLAIFIEARYEKEQILEKYLNEVYFGQIGALEVHGVFEAAHYFFGKDLNQLSIAEIAFMAGVIRGPVVYSPYKHLQKGLQRKDVVLRKLSEQRYIAGPEFEAALHEKLVFASPRQGRNQAPYFVDYVKAETLEAMKEHLPETDLSSQGLRIFTTLDMPLQRRADAAVASTIHDLETKFKVTRPRRLEGLLAAAESSTGFIKSLVGGHSYEETTFNRVLNMKRQVGSAFKPIAYLAALLKGKDQKGNRYTPSYLIEDAPFTYEYDRKTWTPHNYEKGYRGPVTLREAFAHSLNIPMAKVGIDVGLDQIIDVAYKLGITTTLQPVPSLVLGTFDLDALELLQVYSTFANRGLFTDLTSIRLIADKEGRTVASFSPRVSRVFEEPVVEQLDDLLHSVVTEGTARQMPSFGYSKTAYGKTGTTNFYRDAWFAGFSQGLVAVTWVGFDEFNVLGKTPTTLTGATAALPLWAKFFGQARPSKIEEIEPPLDGSLERARIDKTRNCKARWNTPDQNLREELYLHGTVPDDCP